MGFGKLLAARIAEDVEPFRVGLHKAVFDTVVDHLHEMAGSGRSAIDVAFLGGAGELIAAWSTWNVAASGSQSFEDGIKLLNSFLGTADHHAVAAVETPDTTASAD